MVIIGLLAGLVAPRYFEQIGKSNTNVAKAQVDSLSKALDAYRLDVGAYPTTEERLDALVTRPQNAPRWNGPYLQKRAADPWDRPYQYRSPGSMATTTHVVWQGRTAWRDGRELRHYFVVKA
jgi:general secretion pathway protein G